MPARRFWNLSPPLARSGYGQPAEWDPSVHSRSVVICPAPLRNWETPFRVGPLKVVLPSSQVPDIMWTWNFEWMIQDHVLQCFREEGFTGFEVAPVEVTRWNRRLKPGETELPRPPTFWEFLVTGYGGEAPPETGIELLEYCDLCGRPEYSSYTRPELLVDPERWDGSDFFIVWPLPRYLLVTDRVVQLIRKRKYRGCTFVALEDLDLSEDKLGPGLPHPRWHVRGPEAFPKARVHRCYVRPRKDG